MRQHLPYRKGRGDATLTDSWKTFVAHARGVLHEVEVAGQELEDQRGSLTGKMVVGVSPNSGIIPPCRPPRTFLRHWIAVLPAA
jgi:LysR family nitrogen assimilation transcriptional regulator